MVSHHDEYSPVMSCFIQATSTMHITKNTAYLQQGTAVQVGRGECRTDIQQKILVLQTLRLMLVIFFWLGPEAQVVEPVGGFQRQEKS